METNWLDDYLRGWPTTTCAECGESCIGCEGVIKLGELREGLDTRKVVHGACYKKRMLGFQAFQQRASMTCLLCREPCDGSEPVKQLAVGHAMHDACYKKWLVEQDADHLWRRMRLGSDAPTVVLPGEEGMSREQVARRRHAMLFGGRGKRFGSIESKSVSDMRGRPPAGSCNDGASADAGGEDSRPGATEVNARSRNSA